MQFGFHFDLPFAFGLRRSPEGSGSAWKKNLCGTQTVCRRRSAAGAVIGARRLMDPQIDQVNGRKSWPLAEVNWMTE
jgi:hypothetical protein